MWPEYVEPIVWDFPIDAETIFQPVPLKIITREELVEEFGE